MESYIAALDEHFCAQYSDYAKISAIEGFEMPEMISVDKYGNLARKDASFMRLCRQKNKDALLKKFKETLADTDFTFSFSFRPVKDRFLDPSRKNTFSKRLPAALKHCGETAESAGEKLNVEPKFWNKIVKGKLYPEKNTVIALALVCRMQEEDFLNLMTACGFTLDDTSVRDVVVQYLLGRKIFNEEMRDNCLAEYKIENLPIKKGNKTGFENA